MNPIEKFRAAMHAAGIDYTGPIVADGKIHRFKAGDDHARNSWYVLHDGTPAAGAFGCWKRGIKETWCDRERDLSQAEWQDVRQRWAEAECKRKQMETERHAKARAAAAWILNRSRPARTMERYLLRKGVKIFGDLREWCGAVVLPLRSGDGELHSLQFISADGSKKFLSGGRVAGCFYTLADTSAGPLVICEGYATGASIHEAAGLDVVCAMHAGNLNAVAAGLRKKFPGREIIIAADNDQFTDGNPGITKATEVALTFNAKLAVPAFQDISTHPTDFNDLHQLAGLAAVAQQILTAIAPELHAEPPKNVSNSAKTVPDDDVAAPVPEPFPIDCMPPNMAGMIRAVALAHRVPDALPGLMALALVAASLGKGVVLDWRQGNATVTFVDTPNGLLPATVYSPSRVMANRE